jgi:methylthioribulose-1-phosphate dehydratase
MDNLPQLAELISVCRWIGDKGWCPATGGNMSLRQGADECLISGSGKDKASLQLNDFIAVNINTQQVTGSGRPSAETGLHTLIYRLLPQMAVVLHTHSVNATVLSQIEPESLLWLQGYEMQKTLHGQQSHQGRVAIAIFDNDQDIDALARRVADSHYTQPLCYGFLVRGHGLYCWGRSVAEARRHLEGLEFLFQCELQRRQLQVSR